MPDSNQNLPKIEGTLVGVDGNAFAIMGYFQRQARRSGWSEAQIDEVLDGAMSSDYNHLVATIDSHLKS
jgi:hypothetical protein